MQHHGKCVHVRAGNTSRHQPQHCFVGTFVRLVLMLVMSIYRTHIRATWAFFFACVQVREVAVRAM